MSSGHKIQKVLVIDDDPTQVKFLETRLRENGFDITSTQEASEGLRLAMSHEFDLILLDVMMPIINGYNLCRLLKSVEQKKAIPIILLTSRDEYEDIQIGREMGADAYLTKPISMHELLKTIRVIESISENPKKETK